MKTFKLDLNGDVVITDNKIEMISDIPLVIQTLKQILNTNLGEWFSDKQEGIDYDVILTKTPNFDLIRDTIETAIKKVCDQLNIEIETDNYTFEIDKRNMNISFDVKIGDKSENVSLSI